jgi:hypothetical protein
VSIFVPGDVSKFLLGGVWMGPAEVSKYFQRYNQWLAGRDARVEQVVANNGAVAVITTANGPSIARAQPLRFRKYDLIQVNGAGKIGRITAFLDTYPLVDSTISIN